ncbi:hypothetical protein DY000_02022421 [Brassica cretica]|uniref:Uncharacterized protein n=1 Tax=Brassica cretica TaxID=69181 RepID=A0ABQ7DZ73_BRACR|nr:hypothetical protein DY000_02022421 [Brassica cretica]
MGCSCAYLVDSRFAGVLSKSRGPSGSLSWVDARSKQVLFLVSLGCIHTDCLWFLAFSGAI